MCPKSTLALTPFNAQCALTCVPLAWSRGRGLVGLPHLSIVPQSLPAITIYIFSGNLFGCKLDFSEGRNFYKSTGQKGGEAQ